MSSGDGLNGVDAFVLHYFSEKLAERAATPSMNGRTTCCRFSLAPSTTARR
jgi:hypothetical protein